jgi:hypothetical protein
MDWLLAALAEAWQHMVLGGGGALIWTSAIEGLSVQGECNSIRSADWTIEASMALYTCTLLYDPDEMWQYKIFALAPDHLCYKSVLIATVFKRLEERR